MRLLVCPLLCAAAACAQTDSSTQHVIDLALKGNCKEAMPLLDEAMRGSAAPNLKRGVSLAGVRCSMLLNQQIDAMSFLGWLQQVYPKDPEVLFLSVHVFSELSERNAKQLMDTAPDSTLVVQLNAERFETQGDLQKAIAEYRILLKREPSKPGVHYRLGALLLALPPATANSEEARKEFEAELKIDPQSAGAQYYLGEIARQDNKLAEAVDHYSRAVQLYPDFAEAQFGLGRSLLDSDATDRAVPPLEKAVQLAPDNPTAHLALATAYQRLGRKADAVREFALQKTTSEKLNQTTKTLRQNVSGMPVDHMHQ
jgi:Tfp pilus assembly protein PilF